MSVRRRHRAEDSKAGSSDSRARSGGRSGRRLVKLVILGGAATLIFNEEARNRLLDLVFGPEEEFEYESETEPASYGLEDPRPLRPTEPPAADGEQEPASSDDAAGAPEDPEDGLAAALAEPGPPIDAPEPDGTAAWVEELAELDGPAKAVASAEADQVAEAARFEPSPVEREPSSEPAPPDAVAETAEAPQPGVGPPRPMGEPPAPPPPVSPPPAGGPPRPPAEVLRPVESPAVEPPRPSQPPPHPPGEPAASVEPQPVPATEPSPAAPATGGTTPRSGGDASDRRAGWWLPRRRPRSDDSSAPPRSE